jgi:hypothetical protein
MMENKIDKAMKPIPMSYEEFESFPKHVEEFFDLIARRPFELLEKRPFLLGPIYLKLYETEEAQVARAEVPGFTEKELHIVRTVAPGHRPAFRRRRVFRRE